MEPICINNRSLLPVLTNIDQVAAMSEAAAALGRRDTDRWLAQAVIEIVAAAAAARAAAAAAASGAGPAPAVARPTAPGQPGGQSASGGGRHRHAR